MLKRIYHLQADAARLGFSLQRLKDAPKALALRTPSAARAAFQSRRLAIPSSNAPKMSVVIPVYGKFEVSYSCLESLGAVDPGLPIEIIVVDDASPDETQTMLATVDGIKSVKNEVNLGFIGASNRGAERATAPLLCFLNNDTRVCHYWAKHLAQTFAEQPKAGIVGAQLLFPDGTIQESGGTIFRDGSGSHYGRNHRVGESRFDFLRSVDYVSGACLAIPKPLFDTLGGFDRHYAPAYYEDTDLCFRVRQAGYEVYVQPRARVVHYEGKTHGTNPQQGIKRHQVINQGRFFERWRTVLAKHPPPGERSQRAAERERGPKLLVAAPPEIVHALLPLLRALRSEGFRIAVWGISDALDALPELGFEWRHPPEHPSLAAVLSAARGWDQCWLGLGQDALISISKARSLAPDAALWGLCRNAARPGQALQGEALDGLIWLSGEGPPDGDNIQVVDATAPEARARYLEAIAPR